MIMCNEIKLDEQNRKTLVINCTQFPKEVEIGV